MARVQPLRMHPKIILQSGKYGIGLIDAEGTADRQIAQRGIRELDLDIGVAADIVQNFRQRLSGIDQLTLAPGQLPAQLGL